jgi:hypothetical protein
MGGLMMGAKSTVEALMYTFRTRGIIALVDDRCQERLRDLSIEQIDEVIGRLGKMRENYPMISDGLIAGLQEIKTKREQPPDDGWEPPTEQKQGRAR